ncbi:zf-HC2 domain-containing protein [Actinokineospora auranticolor]|uniref:Putative zinc finger protein n=1 Tax=Actinokineospora auranticolor TaxID=155976 RepID=A0A2S6GGM2_9PSEU|nr:zf-HC2 domain-containing protein [Actinokineospora auranticolor]PPK64377.1 putative zinc finger protein [Actinokineospora auranticolor]
MTCTHTFSLGAYLLGALDPAERAAFEAHAAACSACRRELVRLSPLPGLLHRIRVEDFEDTPEVPADLRVEAPRAPEWFDDDPLDAELDPAPAPPAPAPPPPPVVDIDRRRRGRYPKIVAAAAAVIALSVGSVIVYESLGDTAEPGPYSVSWSGTDPASGVRADLDLTDRDWGTEVRIRLHDVPAGKPCKLIVRGRDGYFEVAGWWATGYRQGEAVPGSTSITLARISRIQVQNDDGDVLVEVPAPS